MNITTENNEQHQALITVEIDTTQLERKKQQAAKKLARATHIPGFRPGKAPYHMIVRHLGEGRILEEAVESLIDEIYPKVLDESGVKPYGPGKLEALAIEEEPPTAQFLIPLAPEVTLGDFQTIRLPFEMPEVTDETVEKAVQEMREMYAEVEVVDRPAEETDLVNIVLTGRFAEADDGDYYIDHEAYPVVIEPEAVENSQEWPFVGFSRTLIGLRAEEKKTVSHTYPEDYEDEETENGTLSLKGKTVEFDIEVSKVSSRQIPALDEEFAKKMGPFETIEAYHEAVRKQLVNSNENEYTEGYDEQLLAELLKNAEIKYPQDALDDEINLVLDRLKNRLENQGIGFDLYLKTRNVTEEQVRDELRPGSEQRLKESLVLMEIAQKENVQVDQNEVQHELQHTLGSLLSGMSDREARQAINDDVLRGLTMNVYNNTLINNTLKHLRAMASGELEKQAQLAAETDEATPDTEEPSLEADSTDTSSTVETEITTDEIVKDGEDVAENVADVTETPGVDNAAENQ